MENRTLPRPPLELLELANAYQRSKTLFALIEFQLPTLLARRPLTLAEIARALEIHPLAADSFLNSCIALGLLEHAGAEYRNAPLAEEFLAQGKPGYLGDQFMSYDQTSYPLWANLAQNLRQWQPGATDDELPPDDDQGEAGMRARHNLSLLVGNALGEAFDFSSFHRMLDLGGGTGAMSLSICAQHSQLRSLIFDLPQVTKLAQEYVAESGLNDRIEIMEGNFKLDELPDNFDVALLANLLSVSSEQTNRQLFRRIYERLPAGGAIILSGYVLDDGRAGSLIPLLFCLQDINWQAPDVEREASTYAEWLAAAGFVEIEHRAFCPPTSLVAGRKRSN
ncbi:MAG: 3-hydroxy-5-methyl-1-naphthoate 3-O-methyltransferase [Blastocatellia bacterium]|nr:3-hydroxy-5-methyl-1-naphthoate 3-O-methyltransferase [Blastocatellia bacterium]